MKFLFIILSLIITKTGVAQFIQPCVDEYRISPTYQCNDPFYNPVCGCNGVTYRNQCDAYNVHGVTTWISGVCAGINLDFFPNPVTQNATLKVNLGYPDNVMGNADVKIVDMYGKVWIQRIVNNFNRMQIEFDMSAMPKGVYVLVIQGFDNSVVTRKFAKT